MAFCSYCKEASKEHLKSCVCGNASYCSKDCQVKDWKTHKPSCPLYIIRESPGKGRGLFATRKIKEGQVILEEYPLFTRINGMNPEEFQAHHYPFMDDDTKGKILQRHDPAENMKALDSKTVEELVSESPLMMIYKDAESDESSKIYRIISGSSINICGDENLYSDTNEVGLYHKMSLINHACVPNTIWTWVMGDFKRQQLRAMMIIEKDQEILVNYRGTKKFFCGSKVFRKQELLKNFGFHCDCLECSLEGEDLQENDKMRAEIREMEGEIQQLLSGVGSDQERDLK